MNQNELFFEISQLEKISMHEHFRANGNMEAYLAAMDKLKIKKALFVPTGLPPNNSGYKENMEQLLEIQRKYSDKIIAFCTIDESDNNTVEIFTDCIKKGGKGLKLIGWHLSFYDEPLNSSKMYEVYKKVSEFNVPLLIHIDMHSHPEWQKQFEQVVMDFPDITFIAAHYCKHAPEVEKCGELLEKYPNVYTDLSMGSGISRYLKQINEEPERFRNFILKNQDKILWGADTIVDSSETEDFLLKRIKCDLDLLGKEWFRCEFAKGEMKEISLRGLNLPQDVLRKIYYENPKRVLRIS